MVVSLGDPVGSLRIRRGKRHACRLIACFFLCLGILPTGARITPGAGDGYVRAGFEMDPFAFQVSEHRRGLRQSSSAVRRRSAEALGFLRAVAAADDLVLALRDPDAAVRREAALALAWCGGRGQLPALGDALSDPDWSVRQSAWVALTNLTGMAFPFDALAQDGMRRQQASEWESFLKSIPPIGIPDEVAALLAVELSPDLAEGCKVSASSTYKGPADVLTKGERDSFWQTKNVSFPQHCTIDLGVERQIGCVTVEQYGPGFCMTDYAVQTSLDGRDFRRVHEHRGRTDPRLVVGLEPHRARYVRILSRGSENPVYPTTFYRVHVGERAPGETSDGASPELSIERGLRAAGVLGGPDLAPRMAAIVSARRSAGDEPAKLLVQAGIRGLGRLGDPVSVETLISLLADPYWARYAADALGDCPSDVVTLALVDAYPAYARSLAAAPPERVPADDQPGFESVDRAYETPFALAASLVRMPLESPEAIAAVRRIAPLLLTNLPGDFDGAMLYEPEAHHLIVAYLLERTGVRSALRDLAILALGEMPVDASTLNRLTSDERKALSALAAQGPGGTSYAGGWLPVLCRKGESTEALTRLLAHPNGWVRINAAKAFSFTGESNTVETLATSLAKSKPEASYGYFGGYLFNTAKQGHDDYNAPSPCWREAFTRALGDLGGEEQVDLLVHLLRDDRNVLEVRYAAAASLSKIASPAALEELRQAASSHPFHSIRLLAREALWRRDLTWSSASSRGPAAPALSTPSPAPAPQKGVPDSIVFIRGDNDMPNDFQIDIWRQTYSTTDSGPTYRLGRNLYVLSPVAPDGDVTPLTTFADGYVADCEVSWDGRHVLFARRGGDSDPWWHLYQVGADGDGLRQLTFGPYHDVQPDFLPDGRIVFSSSRVGLRDEYHGYPATGLAVMNPDGSNIQCIGFNLGRDNEPTILPDGRIAFSRLELFYSRLKTELTVQAVFPDGTRNVTLYGPERRTFWRDVTKASGETWWGEAPPRHRVLRVTQPQALTNERLLCASTGGPVIVGPGRLRETMVPMKQDVAITSMYPLGDDRALCAVTPRAFDVEQVDLGLYLLKVTTGELTLLYNDPGTAEFEPRPLASRPVPPVLAATPPSQAFSARLLCASARTSRDPLTRERGALVRIIEGQPIPSRHHTHTSSAGEAWKNHVGTDARVLGTVPLAADGSFFVEVPADRLIHCQVLDSDRRVVGNQLVWMYARPGETRSCVGCHESPDSAPPPTERFVAGAHLEPLACLPVGGEFNYRAKAWQKGTLASETEERTRTVQAINLLGRY